MSGASTIRLAPLTVLVVDDSPVARRMLAISLALAGLPLREVREAGDGEAALHSIVRSEPDLVLCDVHMPTMDGSELLERLACGGWTERVPVVMISSERVLVARARLEAFGARGCLEKPFHPETLGRVVRGIFGFPEAS